MKILNKEVERGKIKKIEQKDTTYYIHDNIVTINEELSHDSEEIENYLFGCLTPDRIEKRQNGQRFNNGKKFYTLTAQDKHGILIDGYIRKLTPIECERLQTVKDGFTSIVSDTQRYKMLGNGWTIDVIAHIFNYLKL